MSEKNTDKSVRSLSVRGKLTNAPLVFQTPDALRKMSSNEQGIRKKTIDNFITAEMRRQQSKLMEEQQMFIAQQLEQHPVEIGSRTHSPSSSGLEEMSTKSAHGEPVDSAAALLREQRAASCRKSRINNKLRKATLQHRNAFLTERVAATKKTLTDLTSKLQKAQQYLLRHGFNGSQLENIRAIYGVTHMPIN
ncbi:protein sisterless A [Zeugodacus cucurbitae]|nr:protein sisterless A [Zeugodacus cucurbitae]